MRIHVHRRLERRISVLIEAAQHGDTQRLSLPAPLGCDASEHNATKRWRVDDRCGSSAFQKRLVLVRLCASLAEPLQQFRG